MKKTSAIYVDGVPTLMSFTSFGDIPVQVISVLNDLPTHNKFLFERMNWARILD